MGAAIIKPNAIGILQGKNELNLHTQGMNSPVSGWTAVETTVYALLIFLTSFLDSNTLLLPVVLNYDYSLYFCSSINCLS